MSQATLIGLTQSKVHHMEIANRYKRPLYVTEFTTPGIAARIAGVNNQTFKKWLAKGRIPAYKNPTDIGDNLIRVGDILTFCIRNDVPYDKDMISRDRIPSKHQPKSYVDRIYAFNVAGESEDARVLFCTLRQFLDYLEYDPFNWFAIGDSLGGAAESFYRHIVEGLNPLMLNAGKFRHHIVAIGIRILGIPFYSNMHDMVAAMPMKKVSNAHVLIED